MTRRESTTTITIALAAQRVGLSRRTVRRYIQRGLLNEALTEGDLVELRRIRRLSDLGVNLNGVEIILRMRRRIQELQVQIEKFEAQLLRTSPTPPGVSERTDL
jgi:MerR family transcriptional regulator/heat shock protein HspR